MGHQNHSGKPHSGVCGGWHSLICGNERPASLFGDRPCDRRLNFQDPQKLDTEAGGRLADDLGFDHDPIVEFCAGDDKMDMLVDFQAILGFDKDSPPADIADQSLINIILGNKIDRRRHLPSFEPS
jgi:hypothetical protein